MLTYLQQRFTSRTLLFLPVTKERLVDTDNVGEILVGFAKLFELVFIPRQRQGIFVLAPFRLLRNDFANATTSNRIKAAKHHCLVATTTTKKKIFRNNDFRAIAMFGFEIVRV
jgi:hypothetical protein